jgi:hypothetical protein
MNVITKAVASIAPGADDATSETGTFDVILSAQSLDRDGEILRQDEWKQPLPDHITFDTDHGMSVATTIGSGKPYLNEDGDLQVQGTYSSIDRAQEVRTLVNEGHIRTTSVAFMTTKTAKSHGKAERELLNGSFVAIPSNRDTVVLASKALDVVEKAGSRNNKTDKKTIQAIHDHAASLGASCADAEAADTGAMDGANKSATTVYVDVVPRIMAAVHEAAVKGKNSEKDSIEGAGSRAAEGLDVLKAAAQGAKVETKRVSTLYVSKALANSVEDLQNRIYDALSDIYQRANPDFWCYVQATFLDDAGKSGTVVYSLNGDSLSRTFEDDGRQVTLGTEVTDVTIITTILPEGDEPDEKSASAAETKTVSDADQEDQQGSDKEPTGESPTDDTTSADTAAADVKSAAAVSADEEITLRARALLIETQAQALL